jgi:hypothetical protein
VQTILTVSSFSVSVWCSAAPFLLSSSASNLLRDRDALIRTGYLDLNAPIPAKKKQTFLHLAVSARVSELIIELLAQGANPNVKDAKGETPFHYAAITAGTDGGKEILTLLVKEGADGTVTNLMQKKTPVDMAPPELRPFIAGLLAKQTKVKPVPPPTPAAAAASPAGDKAVPTAAATTPAPATGAGAAAVDPDGKTGAAADGTAAPAAGAASPPPPARPPSRAAAAGAPGDAKAQVSSLLAAAQEEAKRTAMGTVALSCVCALPL